MSSPAIWIIFPLCASLLLFIFRRHDGIIWTIGLVLTVLLAWLSWQLPIANTITLELGIAKPSFFITDSFSVLGRLFILNDNSRPALLLIYLSTSVWLGGIRVVKKNRLDIPFGIMAASFLSTALAVKPDLYAILFIELAVFCYIPMLTLPNESSRRSVIRFIVIQTIGMCFILYANWSLDQIDQNTAIISQLTSLILGFAIVLAIFPFQSWLPALVEQSHPFSIGLALFVIPTVILVTLVNIVLRFVLLGITDEIILILRIAASLMVISGGLFVFFEKNLARIMGFAVTIQIGLALFTVSLLGGNLRPSIPTGFFYAQIVIWGATFAIWSFAITLIHDFRNSLDLKATQGIFFQMPFACTALLIAHFSSSGAPLLASFPLLFTAWSSLASSDIVFALISFSGCILLLMIGWRVLRNLFTVTDHQFAYRALEPKIAIALLGIGVVVLFILGIFPQVFLPPLMDLGARLFGMEI